MSWLSGLGTVGGALLGSAIPGVGTALGATIGGGLGTAAGGLFGGGGGGSSGGGGGGSCPSSSLATRFTFTSAATRKPLVSVAMTRSVKLFPEEGKENVRLDPVAGCVLSGVNCATGSPPTSRSKTLIR